MDIEDLDGKAASSTASSLADTAQQSAAGAASDSPTEPDATGAESSTDEGAHDPVAAFNERVDQLEGTKPVEDDNEDENEGEGAAATSPSAEGAETGAESDGLEAGRDEATSGTDKANAEQAEVSQQSKGFSNEPEWQRIMRAVNPTAAKEVRGVLRELFTKRNELVRQVAQAKPAVETFNRIEAAVGKEGVANTVSLIEGFHEGSADAERILKELLTDVQTRRGSVISSPDIKTELEKLEAQLGDGAVDEDYATRRKAELLELEAARAERNRIKTQSESAQRKANEERVNKIIEERAQALNSWEKDVAKRDPDYARKQKFVVAEARRLADERQAKSKGLLSPAEMVAVLKEAYESVSADLGQLLPRPKARKVITGGASSLNSRREPQNEVERFNQRVDELESRL
jgi:hypothetical protein